MKFPLLFSFFCGITLACSPPSEDSAALNSSPLARKSFTNPVMQSGADPWVVQKDGWYYHCYSDGNASIKVRKSRILSEIESAPAKLIWKAPEGKPYSKETWAPELHFVQGKWYVYFAADDGKNSNHRMFVLESESNDAMGKYALKGSLQTKSWAIDGTVLELGKKLYFIWSGWDEIAKKQQSLYIAPMKNPWTLADGAKFRQKIEAENAMIKRASVRKTGASNGQVVGKIDYADSSVTFRVKAPKAGDYALDINYGNGSGRRSTQNLIVNDAQKQAVILPSMGWESRQTVTAKIKLKAGDNTIRLAKGDNFAELDFITVKDYGRDPVLISMPEYDWERRGGPDYVNEGPQVLKNGKKTMIIYSASGSWTNDYALGQLTLTGGEDVMNSQAWQKVGAVFQSSNDVYGPGHASFVKTVDGKEDWIVYHAAKMKDSKWSRNVRIQPFTWKADGSPNFGQPKRIDEKLSFPYRQ